MVKEYKIQKQNLQNIYYKSFNGFKGQVDVI